MARTKKQYQRNRSQRMANKSSQNKLSTNDDQQNETDENNDMNIANEERVDAEIPAQTRKPYRYRPGTVALRQIRKAQRETTPCIPRRPFERLVREITQNMAEMNPNFDRIARNLRFRHESINALREAAEAFIIGRFEDAQSCAIHAHRVTVRPCDFELVEKLQRKYL